MDIIDIHAHIVFEETLNFLNKEGPEIGGDEKNPWFRVWKRIQYNRRCT